MLYALRLPYWFDEANTIYYVQQPFFRMLKFVANDFSPPLYYFILRLWAVGFGTSELASGSLSFILYFAAAVFTYRLGCRLFGPSVAAGAVVLLWVSYAALYFATETRMYALLTVLAAASTERVVALLQGDRRRFAVFAYGLVTLAGLYTHYVFWFLVVAQNLAVGLWNRRWSQPQGWRYGAVQLGLISAYVPQVPILWDRIAHWYLSPTSSWANISRVSFDLFWQLPAGLLLRGDQELFLGRLAFVVGVAVLALLLLTWVRVELGWRLKAVRVELRPFDPSVALLLLLITVPLTLFYILNVQELRYASFLNPFFCLVVARGVSAGVSVARQPAMLAGLVGLIATVNTASAFRAPLHYENIAWPAVAKFLVAQPDSGGTVIAAHYDDSIVLSYYYRGPLSIVRLSPLPLVAGEDRAVEEIRAVGRLVVTPESLDHVVAQLAAVQSVWYVRGPSAAFFDHDQLLWALLWRHCTLGSIYEFSGRPMRHFNPLRVAEFRQCQFPS